MMQLVSTDWDLVLSIYGFILNFIPVVSMYRDWGLFRAHIVIVVVILNRSEQAG